MIETAISEEPAMGFVRRFTGWIRPLNSAALVEHPVVADSRDVAGPSLRQAFENPEYRFGRFPFPEYLADSPGIGDEFEDREICQRLSGRTGHFLHEYEP